MRATVHATRESVLAAWLLLAACSRDAAPGDAAAPASHLDASAIALDASALDARTIDARAANTPVPDAGAKPRAPMDAAARPVDSSRPIDAARARDAAPAPDAGSPASDADVMPAPDPFGIRRLYPTSVGGREWFLPDNADMRSKEWGPESDNVTKVSAGVFHTEGETGQIRLNVKSPAGKAWWRNVEMTGYFRYTAPLQGADDLPRQLVLFSRGERHDDRDIAGTAINDGVAAPAGTATWPGYPYGAATINVHCLGTAYHANFFLKGEAVFQKELSHPDGYADRRADVTLSGFTEPRDRFIGLKYIARNADANQRVHLELWVDEQADDHWRMLTQTDDTAGAWASTDAALNGCTSAPFSYSPSQLLSWAGPWVTFRSDSMAIDFKQLSVREIDPLP